MRIARPRAVLLFLCALSLQVALLQAITYSLGYELGGYALALWGTLFPLLLAWWVAEDSRGRRGIYRPFEFGWLVYLILPIYLPYYLYRTRGAAGALVLLGFIVLFFLGSLLQFGISLAS
jgi:hypothetical protein